MRYYEMRCPICKGTILIDFKMDTAVVGFSGVIYVEKPKAWCTNCMKEYHMNQE